MSYRRLIYAAQMIMDVSIYIKREFINHDTSSCSDVMFNNYETDISLTRNIMLHRIIRVLYYYYYDLCNNIKSCGVWTRGCKNWIFCSTNVIWILIIRLGKYIFSYIISMISVVYKCFPWYAAINRLINSIAMSG